MSVLFSLTIELSCIWVFAGHHAAGSSVPCPEQDNKGHKTPNEPAGWSQRQPCVCVCVCVCARAWAPSLCLPSLPFIDLL